MSQRPAGPIVIAAILLGGGMVVGAGHVCSQDSDPPPARSSVTYKGPTALQDPDDPLQSLSWTLGYTLPSRNRLHPGRQQVTTRTDYDIQGQRIVQTSQVGTRQVLPPMAYNPNGYANMAFNSHLRQGWIQQYRQVVTESATGPGGAGQGGLIDLSLPFQLPFTEKVFGQGAPNLRVSGSEQITLSGTSSVVVGQVTGERGGASLFPKLDMRQRLNVNLQGTIGSKLFINVNQNSDALTPLENAIQIRYRGDEDEVIRSVDLGNTSLGLPPTQFISFSTRQEGLFGAKAEAQVGNLGMTLIASRQQSESGTSSYRGGSTETGRTIRDWQYLAGRYFYFFDPDSTPVTNVEDLRVYLDDAVYRNNTELGSRPANAWLDPIAKTPEKPYLGDFHLLIEDTDYSVGTFEAFPDGRQVLFLRVPVSRDQVLAVAFSAVIDGERVEVGTLVPFDAPPPQPDDPPIDLKILRPSNELWGTTDLTQSVWAPANALEIKSVYSLGARDIDLSTFDLTIRQDLAGTEGDNPYTIKNEFGVVTPLIEALGLDQRNNASTTNYVPDGRVDPEYIDEEEGLIIFPDSRPFAPTLADISGTDFRKRSWPVATSQSRPDTLGWYLGPDGQPTPSPPTVQQVEVAPDLYTTRSDELSRKWSDISLYYMETTVRAAQSSIQLNAPGGLLEGSETVRLNGRELQRGTDYTIFYDSGQVTLLNPDATAPGADLQITYSFDSPFARGQRSLVGGSLSTLPNPASSFSFATTWLHESNNVPDRRPRLGAEPSKTTVGDISGRLQFQPWALTRFADSLPLVEAQAPSTFELTGAVGVSLPNPNTKGEVFLDDMEGTSVTISPGVSRGLWFYTSLPEPDAAGLPAPGEAPNDVYFPVPEQRGRLLWFSPTDATVGDINPGETNSTERDQLVPVLETIYIPQDTLDATVAGSWAGLVAPISISGVDVSSAQYIEIWVNDFKNATTGGQREGEIVIDLGTVSEDAVWDALIPPAPANQTLDYEDRNQSGGQIEVNEDTGLDLLFDPAEPTNDKGRFAYYPAPPDWAGEDSPQEINTSLPEKTTQQKIAKYIGINGTEKNQRADSEDLNANFLLETDNNYYQYVVDLSERATTDNGLDFGVNDPRNGWRMYRIPLDGYTRQYGTPNLTLAKHVRFWMRGIDPGDTLDVQIASIEIVGNRWELTEASQPGSKEQFRVAVVSNKETSEYYPPFPVEVVNNVAEREQSVSFEFKDFEPGTEFSAFRRLFEARDYTLYQSVGYYLNPRGLASGEDVEFFLRFVSDGQSDTLNYYEIATTLSRDDPRRGANGWINLDIPVPDLSTLKISPEIPDSVILQSDTYLFGPGDVPGTYPINPRAQIGDDLQVTLRGSPSFSRIRRLNAGLRNKTGQVIMEGEIWFNELRMGNVRRDKGWASRGTLNLRMSDVLGLSGTIDVTNADFLRLGERSGSGTETQRYDLRGELGLHKFLGFLQLRAPLTVTLGHTRQTPKFRPNSDLLFVGDSQASAISQRDGRGLTLTLSREPRGRGSFLTRYTVDALRASATVNRDYNLNITQADTTFRKAGNLSYNLGFSDIRPLRLLRKLDLWLWPRSLQASLAGSQVDRRVWSPTDAAANVFALTNNTSTRSGVLSFNMGFQPLRILNYTYSATRDLIDAHFLTDNPLIAAQRQPTTVAGIDLGRMTGQAQNVNITYNPPLVQFLKPRLAWTSGSTKNIDPNLTREDYTHVATDLANSNNASVSITVPIGSFLEGRLAPDGVARRPPPPSSTQGSQPRFPRRNRGGEADSTGEEDGESSTKEQLYGFFTGVLRFRDLQLSSTFLKGSAYQRVYGEVPIEYQLGLTRDVGLGQTVFPVEGAPYNQSVRQGSQFRGNTNITVLRQIGVDFAYQKRKDQNESNGLARVSEVTTWPDIRITWGDLSSRLPLIRHLFEDFRIVNTSYSLETTATGTLSNPSESVTKTVNWRPLLSVQGTFRNGWRVNLNANSSRSETLTRRAGGARTQSVRSNNTYLLGFARRFTRAGNGRDIDFKVDFNWSRTNSVTGSSVGLAQEDQRDDMRINTSTSTRFTRAMSGTFGLEVGQERRPVVNWTRRSIRLYFSTGFTF